MSTILFADDTSFFWSKSFEILMTSTNNDLIKYREWTVANRHSLFMNKTHVMRFTTKPLLYQPQSLSPTDSEYENALFLV